MIRRAILEIAQEAAERSQRARPPSTLFGAGDRAATILRVAAADTVQDMMRAPQGGQGWSDLQSTWVFRLTPGVGSYMLPPDYGSMIPDTDMRRSHTLGLLGPTPARVWHDWLYGGGVPPSSMGWIIRNGRLYVEPVPTVSEYVTIGYVSRWPVVQFVDGVDHVQADIAASEAQRVDVPLVAREGFLATTPAALGMTLTEYEALFRLIRPTQGVDTFSGAMARAKKFARDADMPALDDHVLSLGMTARLLKGLREPYAEEMAEYEEARDVALAKDAGGGRNISLEDWREEDVRMNGVSVVFPASGEVGGGAP